MTPHAHRKLIKMLKEARKETKEAARAYMAIWETDDIIAKEDKLGKWCETRRWREELKRRLDKAGDPVLGSAMSPNAWARHQERYHKT